MLIGASYRITLLSIERRKHMPVKLKTNGLELGIVTRDPEAALKFYRDTLGLALEAKHELPGGTTLWMLKCGDSIVKINHQGTPPPADAPPGGVSGATGYRYCTLHVSNMAEVLEEIRDAGYAVPVPEMEIAPGIKIAMVEDPDGNWVELVD